MPKISKPLSALEVKRIDKRGHHTVGGVPGLLLSVSKRGSRSWTLRILIGGKRRDIGLGGYPGVSLAQARERAEALRWRVRNEGIDPVLERQQARSALLAAQAKAITFEKVAREVITRKQAEAGNLKHARQWESTLETYAFPLLGKMAVSDIELAHVKQVLEPIWTTKTETATRVRQRIEAVLAFAIVSGYRETSNVAVWKGNLDAVLPAPARIAPVRNHPSLPFEEMYRFWPDLRQRRGNAARCLELAILTAARPGEALGARWDEINLTERVRIIPAERMKVEREHRVPLSGAAIKLLEAMPRERELIFPAPRGGQLSDAAMSSLIKRLDKDSAQGYRDPKQDNRVATPHGFRSTFRDWAAERTSTANHIAEMALAHTVKGVEGAYRRGDLLAKRARLMEQWAEFIATAPATGNVSAIRSSASEVVNDG